MLYLKATGRLTTQSSSTDKSYATSICQSDLKGNTALNNVDMS